MADGLHGFLDREGLWETPPKLVFPVRGCRREQFGVRDYKRAFIVPNDAMRLNRSLPVVWVGLRRWIECGCRAEEEYRAEEERTNGLERLGTRWT